MGPVKSWYGSRLGVMACIALAFTAGCGKGRVGYTGGSPMYGFYMSDHERAVATAEASRQASNPKRSDYVQYQMSLGLNKLYLGDLAGAETHWKAVAEVVDSGVGAGRGAMSVAGGEKNRYFKGSTVERTALWYYRGLTFLLSGDEDQATVCFRKAMEVDKSSGMGREGRDHGLLWYFMARHFMSKGPMEADNLRIATEAAKTYMSSGEFVSQDALEKHNLIILIDGASGPLWNSDSNGQKWLVRDSESVVGWPMVSIDGGPAIPAVQAVNYYHQATSERDGGADKVRDAKVVARAAGKVAVAVLTQGEATGFDRSGSADRRTWDELPDSTWLVSVEVPPGVHDINIKYRYNDYFTVKTDGFGDKRKENEDPFNFSDKVGGDRRLFGYPNWWEAGKRGPSMSSKFWYMKAGVAVYTEYTENTGPYWVEYEQTFRSVGVGTGDPTILLARPNVLQQAQLASSRTVSQREFQAMRRGKK